MFVYIHAENTEFSNNNINLNNVRCEFKDFPYDLRAIASNKKYKRSEIEDLMNNIVDFIEFNHDIVKVERKSVSNSLVEVNNFFYANNKYYSYSYTLDIENRYKKICLVVNSLEKEKVEEFFDRKIENLEYLKERTLNLKDR